MEFNPDLVGTVIQVLNLLANATTTQEVEFATSVCIYYIFVAKLLLM